MGKYPCGPTRVSGRVSGRKSSIYMLLDLPVNRPTGPQFSRILLLLPLFLPNLKTEIVITQSIFYKLDLQTPRESRSRQYPRMTMIMTTMTTTSTTTPTTTTRRRMMTTKTILFFKSIKCHIWPRPQPRRSKFQLALTLSFFNTGFRGSTWKSI